MAHSLSAKKRVRQNDKRRLLNKSRKSALKTVLRKFDDTLGGNDASVAEQRYRAACKSLDREATRGIIHRNAAARTKSKLAKRLNALKSKLHAD